MSSSDAKKPEPQAGGGSRRLLVLLLLAIVFGVLYYFYRDELSFAKLAEREQTLRTFQQQRPAATYTIAFTIYVLVTAISLPGATVLTLAFAWLFKFTGALILVSLASTTGATCAFLLSRYLIGDFVQRRFGDRLDWFNRSLDEQGSQFLFVLRLIPLVPFFAVNALMGLTRMRATTYWWVSQIGMLPGTILYVFAGSSVPSMRTLQEKGASGIFTWKIALAFTLLALFPLVVKLIMSRRKPAKPSVSYADPKR